MNSNMACLQLLPLIFLHFSSMSFLDHSCFLFFDVMRAKGRKVWMTWEDEWKPGDGWESNPGLLIASQMCKHYTSEPKIFSCASPSHFYHYITFLLNEVWFFKLREPMVLSDTCVGVYAQHKFYGIIPQDSTLKSKFSIQSQCINLLLNMLHHSFDGGDSYFFVCGVWCHLCSKTLWPLVSRMDWKAPSPHALSIALLSCQRCIWREKIMPKRCMMRNSWALWWHSGQINFGRPKLICLNFAYEGSSDSADGESAFRLIIILCNLTCWRMP